MPIDPVILMIEEIRKVGSDLRAQCKLNAQRHSQERDDSINRLRRRISKLYEDLVETVPTSSLGASELVHIASRRLIFSHAHHAFHMERIAERLGAGQRNPQDLIWLRAMVRALEAGKPDDRSARIAAILAQAIKGAAQPVLIHRHCVSQHISRPNLEQLSQGPTAFFGA
jgi:hypothetical protein